MSLQRIAARTVPEGDGLTVRRLMPVHGLRHFDPFVLWDHFDIAGAGFPDHPHRGFEAITYLFDGAMRHSDNLGHAGVVRRGGAQRFTAGRGMIHSEMPVGHAAGIQLWINLPARLKQVAPAYQQVDADGMPETRRGGVSVRHIVGECGAIRLRSHVEYLDVTLTEQSVWQRAIPVGWRGLIYMVSGHVTVGGMALAEGEALLIEDEPELTLSASADSRLMWCIGRPHREPIRQHGPFVD
jgi:hypothetical protein